MTPGTGGDDAGRRGVLGADEARLRRVADSTGSAGILVAAGDGDAVRPGGAGDAFEIGSVTKVFNARLLLVLAGAGLVRLDEPAAACLGHGWRLGPHVTLERLASHRSGLPRLPRRAWRSMRDDREDPYRTLTVDLKASLPPRIPRPRWFRYSNFGAALLGHALAARAGVPWSQLLREHVLDQLDLHETGVDRPVAQPHSRRGRPVPAWTLDAVCAAGALRSTAADLVRFLRSPPPQPLGWMTEDDALWHNGGTGGSAAFVGRGGGGAPVVLLANAAVAGPLTRIGLRLLSRR